MANGSYPVHCGPFCDIKTDARSGVGRTLYHGLSTKTEWANKLGVTPTKLVVFEQTGAPVVDVDETLSFNTTGTPTYAAETPFLHTKGLRFLSAANQRLQEPNDNPMESTAETGKHLIVVGHWDTMGNHNITNSASGTPTNGFNFYSITSTTQRLIWYDGVTSVTLNPTATPAADMGWGAWAIGIDRTTDLAYFAYKLGGRTGVSTASVAALGASANPSVFYNIAGNPASGLTWSRAAYISGNYSPTNVLDWLCLLV